MDIRIHLPVELVHALLPNLEVSATKLPDLKQVIQVVVATIGRMIRSPDESTQLIVVNRKRPHIVRLESKGGDTSYLPSHAIALLCDWNRSEYPYRDVVLWMHCFGYVHHCVYNTQRYYERVPKWKGKGNATTNNDFFFPSEWEEWEGVST